MTQLSMYHSATGKQAPHCINLLGLGKTGAQMIDAFLRTGEIEDLLEDPRARLTCLAVDIGEGDMRQLRQYADAFYERLDERGIPRDRAQIRTLSLQVPDSAELAESMARVPDHMAREFPRFSWAGEDYDFASWLAPDARVPTVEKHYQAQLELPAEDEHADRAVAKAIYLHAYFAGDRPMYHALREFADSINRTKLPSIVLVPFGVGGGTGSGMVVDIARHLSSDALGRRVPVVGVGLLPCSGDPEYQRGASVAATLDELDCMIDEGKNAGVIRQWGDLYRNPFTGGVLLLPQEQSWERLFRYTTIKKGVLPEVRHRQALHVTNKFVDDSFARFVVHDHGREFFRMMRPSGFTGAPHERVSFGAHNFTIFNVAKLMHPGVEVLPGEPMSKWRGAISDWIGYLPKWMGVREGFKTEFVEAHVYSARAKWNDTLQLKLEETLRTYLLPGEDGALYTTRHEFFDELTLYVNVVIPGVAKVDLTAYQDARQQYDAASEEARAVMSSWLLELGVSVSQPSAEFDGMAGKCVDGGTPWNTGISMEALRGTGNPAAAVDYTKAVMAGPISTVVPTP
ncbi:conserved hypothetical protein [Nostocoides australiense Ben110]|uniref:Tubulin-like protein n=1 Tax=Nostocoides australiense Ben110 TaxID=1193182 RepID=W6K1T2_9MICO|nr:tubulin-like doman-containing protein [Tetrasphaera australiensis]CCH75432.1 conserved hypothetical protein [Tetrasphaera australiensis Ben110]